jgi:hypothetical protein
MDKDGYHGYDKAAEDEEFNRIEREASLRRAAVREAVSRRQWIGLTDQERNQLWRDVVKWGDPSHGDVDLMKALEARLKELNT